MSSNRKGTMETKKKKAAKPRGAAKAQGAAKTKTAAKPRPAKRADTSAEAAAPVSDATPELTPELTPGPTPEPAPAARGGPRGGKMAVAVFVFIVVLGVGGFATGPLWWPALAPYLAGGNETEPAVPVADAQDAKAASLEKMRVERRELRRELERLIARLETVENALDDVKKMVRATSPPSENMDGGASVLALTERLDQLEKDGATLKGLARRVDQIETRGAPQAGDARARAMILAAANLRAAVAGEAPYAAALDAFTAIAGDDPEVRVAVKLLAGHAATGIPTLATLRVRFDGLAGRVVQASKKKTEDGGWMDRAVSRLASLVTLRRVDGRGDAASPDAAVARAEERLEAGDLAAAVEALRPLAGAGRADGVLGPWLDDAKARLAADKTLAALHAHAVAMLAPAGPSTGPNTGAPAGKTGKE